MTFAGRTGREESVETGEVSAKEEVEGDFAAGEVIRLGAGVERALFGAVRGSLAVVKELIDMKDSD